MSPEPETAKTKSAEDPRLRLVATRPGPSVELARWLLECRRIPYAEEVNAPAFHALASWRAGVKPELPLLLTPAGACAGIHECLDALDERCRRDEKVYAGDEKARTETKEAIEVFYQKLFRQAVQVYYFHLLDRRDLVVEFVLDGTPWWQGLLVRA